MKYIHICIYNYICIIFVPIFICMILVYLYLHLCHICISIFVNVNGYSRCKCMFKCKHVYFDCAEYMCSNFMNVFFYISIHTLKKRLQGIYAILLLKQCNLSVPFFFSNWFIKEVRFSEIPKSFTWNNYVWILAVCMYLYFCNACMCLCVYLYVRITADVQDPH